MNKDVETNFFNYIEKQLVDNGLNLVNKKSYNIAYSVTYFHPTNIYLRFTYEYVDMTFNFYVYVVKNEYSSKEKMFWKIFMEMDPSVKFEDIQPAGRDYLPALQRNSELLERFLDLVFKQGKTELIQELFD